MATDILCKVCGEPWDIEELHDVPGMTYHRAFEEFRRVGCAVFGTKHNTTEADPMVAVLTDMLGDDVDGLASSLDDMRFLMGEE